MPRFRIESRPEAGDLFKRKRFLKRTGNSLVLGNCISYENRKVLGWQTAQECFSREVLRSLEEDVPEELVISGYPD